MIIEKTFYGIKCNRCGAIYEDGEHSYFENKGEAEDNLEENDWVGENNEHYCPDCYEWVQVGVSYNVLEDTTDYVAEMASHFTPVVWEKILSFCEDDSLGEDCKKYRFNPSDFLTCCVNWFDLDSGNHDYWYLILNDLARKTK